MSNNLKLKFEIEEKKLILQTKKSNRKKDMTQPMLNYGLVTMGIGLRELYRKKCEGKNVKINLQYIKLWRMRLKKKSNLINNLKKLCHLILIFKTHEIGHKLITHL